MKILSQCQICGRFNCKGRIPDHSLIVDECTNFLFCPGLLKEINKENEKKHLEESKIIRDQQKTIQQITMEEK